MNANCFREDELITKQVNGQVRVFPIFGARLRLAHEQNDTLSLQTEMLNWDGQYAIFKCCAITGKGQFIGYGTANSQRDSRLSDSLVELAETRSIARALRFAGYGVEYTSAEEVSAVGETEREHERSDGAPHGNNGNGKPATAAQVRLLYMLAKRANLGDEDKQTLLSPLGATTFNELSCKDASSLITQLKTQVAS
ncbi:MAG: hypothetical protein ACLQPD_07930 [Desulfomonilaceae bacterium]